MNSIKRAIAVVLVMLLLPLGMLFPVSASAEIISQDDNDIDVSCDLSDVYAINGVEYGASHIAHIKSRIKIGQPARFILAPQPGTIWYEEDVSHTSIENISISSESDEYNDTVLLTPINGYSFGAKFSHAGVYAVKFECRVITTYSEEIFYFSLRVIVDEEPTTTLALDHDVLTVPIGEAEIPEDEVQLKAYIDGEETTNVIWESDNESIVSVDNQGNLQGIQKGTAKVTAYTPDRKQSASCNITVGYEKQMEMLALAMLANDVGITDSKGNPKGLPIPSPGENLRDYGKKIGGSAVWESKPQWNGKDAAQMKFIRDVLSEYTFVSHKLGIDGYKVLQARDKAGQLYIAYGGTNTDSKGDLGADILLAVANELNPQFIQAMQDFDSSGGNAELVGYSLGGALAAHVSQITGAKAWTFNGANGLILDDTYMIENMYDPAKAFKSFTGADTWNFPNYYADGGLLGINRLVAMHNLDKYETFKYKYDVKFTPSEVGTHSYFALIHFDEETNTFAFNDEIESTGRASEPFQIGQVIFGTTGDDELKTGLYNPVSIPGGLADVINVAANIFVSQYAYGGYGNDTLTTGLHNDYLIGGSGSNTLSGGAGSDTYVITDGSTYHIDDPQGHDRIMLIDPPADLDDIIIAPTSDGNLGIYITGGPMITINSKRNFIMPGTFKIVDIYDNVLWDITDLLKNVKKQNDDYIVQGLSFYSKPLSYRLLSNSNILPEPENPISAFNIIGDVILEICDQSGNVIDTVSVNDYQPLITESGYYYPQKGNDGAGITAYLLDKGYTMRISGTGKVSVTGIVYNEAQEMRQLYSVRDIDLSGGAALLASTDSGEMSKVNATGQVEQLVVEYDIPILGITLSEEELHIDVGQTLMLNTLSSPGDTTQKIVWASGNLEYLSVDENGNITGITDGQAVVYAFSPDGREYAACVVTVGEGIAISDTDTDSENERRPANTTMIIILSLVGVMLLVGIAGGVFFTKRKKKQ